MSEVNRRIYEEVYSPSLLERTESTSYDRNMADLRDSCIRSASMGRRTLDLCCGTGAYLALAVPFVGEAWGLDFSERMLRRCRQRLPSAAVRLIQGDARRLPFADGRFDLVYSFASLYYVPDVPLAIQEVGRVLCRGGHAVLELGNQRSLNTVVSSVQHHNAGWAAPCHVSVSVMEKALMAAGLEVEEWRSFQLLPMYGAPRRLRWLAPLLSARWKTVLGVRLRGRMLDERLSSAPILRRLAFRHLIVARKL